MGIRKQVQFLHPSNTKDCNNINSFITLTCGSTFSEQC